MPLKLEVDDILQLKKAHACGNKNWRVLRKGMDFCLRCEGCGRDIWSPRQKVEKAVRRVIRDGQSLSLDEVRAEKPISYMKAEINHELEAKD